MQSSTTDTGDLMQLGKLEGPMAGGHESGRSDRDASRVGNWFLSDRHMHIHSSLDPVLTSFDTSFVSHHGHTR